MDARDRLREYLEQRRELGESEFVLDGLSVEEALDKLGVRGGGAGKAHESPREADDRADECSERGLERGAAVRWCRSAGEGFETAGCGRAGCGKTRCGRRGAYGGARGQGWALRNAHASGAERERDR